MLELLKRTIRTILNIYPRWICRREYESQVFNRFNERPIEYGFVFRKLGEIYPLKILDVGTGTTALPHLMRNCGSLVTAIDNIRDYWPVGITNRHFHVIDDDITKTQIESTFDLITCISVLEHIQNPDQAIEKIFSLMKPGGYLVLTFPYNENAYTRNVYELPGSSYGQRAPYVTQEYSRREIDRWLENTNAKIVEQEYWEFWEGDHWTVGKQLIPPRSVSVDDKHQLTCLLLQKPMGTDAR